MTEVNSEVIEITPELAQRFLQSSPGNRPIRTKYVDFLARQMTDGRWELNGETIILDVNGRILDGHHRCAAVVKSGKTIESFVISGIPRRTFATIDTGASKSGGDALSIGNLVPVGVPATNVSAVARLVMSYDASDKTTSVQWIRTARFSNDDIAKAVRKEPMIGEISRIIWTCKVKLLRKSGVAAAAVLMARKSENRALDWLSGVMTGEGLSSDDPRFLLRERILSQSLGSEPSAIFLVSIKSANAYLSGSPAKILRFNKSEVMPRLAA